MGKNAEAQKFKRKNRQLKVSNMHLARAVNLLANACEAYANDSHWKLTDETIDVTNEAGIIIGKEIVRKWVGPGPGPMIARSAMTLSGLVKQPVKEETNNAVHNSSDEGMDRQGPGPIEVGSTRGPMLPILQTNDREVESKS